jgi:hypothetical protein
MQNVAITAVCCRVKQDSHVDINIYWTCAVLHIQRDICKMLNIHRFKRTYEEGMRIEASVYISLKYANREIFTHYNADLLNYIKVNILHVFRSFLIFCRLVLYYFIYIYFSIKKDKIGSSEKDLFTCIQ